MSRQRWVIQIVDHDLYTVLQRETPRLTRVPWSVAERYVRRHAGSDDLVLRESSDGYRTKLTLKR